MSEVSEVTTPNVTSEPKQRKARKDVPFASCHVKFAASHNIDVTRAAKLNRSYIRSNFDMLCKFWPALRSSQKVNRDSAPYPKMIPAKAAEMIVKRNIPTAKR